MDPVICKVALPAFARTVSGFCLTTLLLQAFVTFCPSEQAVATTAIVHICQRGRVCVYQRMWLNSRHSYCTRWVCQWLVMADARGESLTWQLPAARLTSPSSSSSGGALESFGGRSGRTPGCRRTAVPS
jgi:hypothetical protein